MNINKELESGEVSEVKLKDSVIEKYIGAIVLEDNLSTFATKKLIEYIKNQ